MVSSFKVRRGPDTKVMFSVSYADGRTAYMRVDKEAALHGNMVVMGLGREQQERGELPSGAIASVKRVR